MTRTTTHKILSVGLAAMVLLALPVIRANDNDEDGELTGSVELVYRSVSVDGSGAKYDEDYDALSSGARLGSLSLDWFKAGELIDYANLEAAGLGGDPYERARLAFGRQNKFDVVFKHSKQDYIYDLFELVPDEDGAAWDSERRNSNLDVKIHARENIDVFLGFHETERTGDSFFMKDISRDVFRMETPLDQLTRRYTVGAQFKLGEVDLLFKHQLRRYDNQFDNFTEGDTGLNMSDSTVLDHYDWRQNDSGSFDTTTVRVRAPLGDRVTLGVSVLGTLLGEEELRSRVRVEQLGTAFTGLEFGGTCAASGATCSTDATCDAIVAGDVCVADVGVASADLEGDNMAINADLSVRIAAPLDLHLQYRSLDRELNGVSSRDLNGDGVFEDEDGDGTPGSITRLDYNIDTLTALLDYRPIKQFSVRAGLRRIDRDLMREGFSVSGPRDDEFVSDGDETVILGIVGRPVDWVRISADIEDGDIDQGFTPISPTETKQARFRVILTPNDGKVRIGATYRDFENNRPVTGVNVDNFSEGTSWSLNVGGKAGERVDYAVSYSEQEIDSNTRIRFDTAGFFGTEEGFSLFDTDNSQFNGQLNVRCSDNWRAYLRYWMAEAMGANAVLGDVTPVVSNLPIDQDFYDAEIGATYDFSSGIFVGGALRSFDFDDVNDLLDYEGEMVILRGGFRF